MHSILNSKKQFVFLLILFLGIFNCSTQETHSGDIAKMDAAKVSTTDNNITEKYWKLVELYGQKVTANKNQKKEPHFILKVKDTRITGSGNCNSFTGSYELSGMNRIKISQIASTMMACINDMETEVEFFRALESADNYYVNGDTLQLNRARMAPLAKFEAVYLK
jgi:heat shock protein HslJ